MTDLSRRNALGGIALAVAAAAPIEGSAQRIPAAPAFAGNCASHRARKVEKREQQLAVIFSHQSIHQAARQAHECQSVSGGKP